jgi:hypothetical protein
LEPDRVGEDPEEFGLELETVFGHVFGCLSYIFRS